MRAVVIAVLLALNLALVVSIVRTTPSASSEFQTESEPPVSRRGNAVAQSVSSDEPEPDLTSGRTMFGAGSAAADAKPPPGIKPTLAQSASYRLLGVLLTEGGDGQRSATILLKHGSPPKVEQYRIGGRIDDWHLASATRSTAVLINDDGAKLYLNIDNSAKQ